MLTTFIEVTLLHVYRKANLCVDNLAHHNEIKQIFFTYDSLNFISHLLLDDACETNYLLITYDYSLIL